MPKNSVPRTPALPSVQGLLNLKGLSAHKLTASSARDLLADAVAIGPNPGLPELAGWLQRAFQSSTLELKSLHGCAMHLMQRSEGSTSELCERLAEHERVLSIPG